MLIQNYLLTQHYLLFLVILGMPRVLKYVWPSMNRYRMFFVQTSTLPPRMHQELTKHGRFYNQNNQLPTKSHVELKDNSIGAIHG